MGGFVEYFKEVSDREFFGVFWEDECFGMSDV